jgi:Na+-transporting methylmalonyl-CoA/oxaloacetate decarboxylase gamma subunit
MGANLLVALQITIVGMGLVFGAIILLWIVVVVLVRLTSQGVADSSESPPFMDDQDRRRKAAAIAVAAALASENNLEPREFPLPPTAVVSPWQSVMRSNILNKRGRIR